MSHDREEEVGVLVLTESAKHNSLYGCVYFDASHSVDSVDIKPSTLLE